ncbi:MAG TPA: tRNA (adenosine(37)-N6)-dimethylallyltransferase MiaA [Candidatus Magasanikbacteria bacterium]|nr:tRNA (adenosine(37)-N6)-dimethylallyltransferase MiaA [Candidatus Magasanikbacteria bacterium]
MCVLVGEEQTKLKSEEPALPKMIVLVGPTASGKTDWALRLSKLYNAEIISADSRQVYKKMNIGTAKETGEWHWSGLHRVYMIGGVPHHLIDFLDPGKFFTMVEFHDEAIKIARSIVKNGKIPFVVGGTGLYVHALVDNLQIPRVPPNKKLRKSLEEKTTEELMVWLEKLDPETAQSVDRANRRRVTRALEVCILSGAPFSGQQQKGAPLFDVLQIGIDISRQILDERISVRVDKMMKLGLLAEIKDLLRQKYSWELPAMSGIGYRQFQDYFENKADIDQCIENLKRDTRRYARRQLTWFKRDKRIRWCENFSQVESLVRDFLGGKKVDELPILPIKYANFE